ncbi:hippocampus abundant transcript-like protein 1 [Heracleum sosnowskyi]|uniref:Hippocampus abundant transcript-like protein 1 n=1 Tax=Heracleum sosnowskyi TaxID=360622 RepID=A0AAD8N3Q9_9APIA|nr:hippocampus abundant transcript-like protein 1 [Heracleum sosnowskyi]
MEENNDDKLGRVRHLFVTVFLSNLGIIIVTPAMTDITMSALCPDQDQCSLAIYLSGFQQAIIGVGSVIMMPLIGNLSDVYGRKAMLTLPMTVSIIPLVILAYSRERNYFYAYFVFRTLTAMVADGSVQCLALAYVADSISEGKRCAAIGMLSGVGSVAYLGGTLVARFLSAAQASQASAFISILATVYMRIFLKESLRQNDAITQPILKTGIENCQRDGESSSKIKVFKKIPSPSDFVFLLKSSRTFSLAATVAFFQSFGDGGLASSLLYFLKARFHFSKDQFADLFLIGYLSSVISQLLIMPLLVPLIGEEKLLSMGMLVGFLNMLVYSIAWSVWIPYAITGFCMFVMFASPCLRSMVSKQVGHSEQGMAQGCISGISSVANIISPVVFSPFTALFLSDRAPFDFPGFSLLCIGLAYLIAFIPSTMITTATPISSGEVANNDFPEA